MGTPEETVFITTEQAARRYNVHVETIRRWARAGKIAAVRIGRKYHVSVRAMDAAVMGSRRHD